MTSVVSRISKEDRTNVNEGTSKEDILVSASNVKLILKLN